MKKLHLDWIYNMENNLSFFYKMKYCLILGMALQLVCLARDFVEVFGARPVNKDVQLIFKLTDWPAGFGGFHVMRRSPDEKSSQWQKLTIRPVLARPFAEVDWLRDFGLPKDRAEELKAWCESLPDDQRLLDDYLDSRSFSELPGTREGRQIYSMAYHMSRGSEDFRNFLVHGVGFVDVTAERDLIYEYGLFPVWSGKMDIAPAITCRIGEPLDFRELEIFMEYCGIINNPESGIWVKWLVPVHYCRTFKFDMFRLYRADAGKDQLNFEKIIDVPGFKKGEGENENRYFFFQDRPFTTGGDPGKSYVYKIVPVNYFKEELPVSWTVEYRPEQKDARE